MIERDAGIIHFVCDACPESLDTGCSDFAEANASRQRDGWAAEKVGQDWIHLCPNCRERGAPHGR